MSEENNSFMHYIIRPESIIMGFLKAFFKQEKLYKQIKNEFRYIDGIQQNSLKIQMSETFGNGTINSIPALVLQEMGATEAEETMDHGRNWDDFLVDKYAVQATFYHPLVIHCIAGTKEAAKFLQSIASQSIIGFRKGIYELGVDNISGLQLMAPQRMEAPDLANPTSMYDCPITLNMKMAQQWIISRTEYGDVQPEEMIQIMVTFALENLEYDETCTPISSQDKWFAQQIIEEQNNG